MVASPTIPGDPWERLAHLEQVVAALANKTLFSAAIGAGGLTVNGGSVDVNVGGIKKFHTGVDLTVIRDAAGDVIISDDPVAGWGFTQPNLSVPFYVTSNTASYFPFISANAGTDLPLYAGQAPANNPKMSFKYQAILQTSSAATCTYTLFVTIGVNTYTMDTVTLSGSSLQSSVRSGTWLFPANVFGQLANYNLVINYTNSGTVGVTEYAFIPIYLYGSGQ